MAQLTKRKSSSDVPTIAPVLLLPALSTTMRMNVTNTADWTAAFDAAMARSAHRADVSRFGDELGRASRLIEAADQHTRTLLD